MILYASESGLTPTRELHSERLSRSLGQNAPQPTGPMIHDGPISPIPGLLLSGPVGRASVDAPRDAARSGAAWGGSSGSYTMEINSSVCYTVYVRLLAAPASPHGRKPASQSHFSVLDPAPRAGAGPRSAARGVMLRQGPGGSSGSNTMEISSSVL